MGDLSAVLTKGIKMKILIKTKPSSSCVANVSTKHDEISISSVTEVFAKTLLLPCPRSVKGARPVERRRLAGTLRNPADITFQKSRTSQTLASRTREWLGAAMH
jgi:hypothetical protein